MKEFAFFDDFGLNMPLGDEISVVQNIDDDLCLVSNSPLLNTQCYAPEINFYLKNSTEDTIQKVQNTSILYEARAISFDLAKDMDFSQEVGKNIIVIGEGFDNLEKTLKEKKLAVLRLKSKQIEEINGSIGSLEVKFTQDDELFEVDTDQIIWKNAPSFALKQSGVINIEEQNDDEILKLVEEKIGNYEYKNYISYNSSICQYHERRQEICAKCEEVCPTVAIVKIDEKKHLQFSHIDCLGCGGCISVCPSGALDYSQMPQTAFYDIAKLYKDKIPLIIPRKMQIDNLSINLPKDILPLAIEGEKYLHEAHFLSLLQQSGSQVIFYSDFLSKGTKDCISIVNQIYTLKYGKEGILVAMNEEELAIILEKATKIEESFYDLFSNNLQKREVFSKRLQWLVGNENLGIAKSGLHVRYGNVKVIEDKCTLCLSCVDACNIGALTADAKDNSLRLNASICTTCGYCEATCPEKDCMEVVRGEIPLIKGWFDNKILAQDTLFECIICHKPFATTKSIMKIAKIMEPLFLNDDTKLKSLYCCADCKPKLMFESYLAKQEAL